MAFEGRRSMALRYSTPLPMLTTPARRSGPKRHRSIRQGRARRCAHGRADHGADRQADHVRHEGVEVLDRHAHQGGGEGGADRRRQGDPDADPVVPGQGPPLGLLGIVERAARQGDQDDADHHKEGPEDGGR